MGKLQPYVVQHRDMITMHYVVAAETFCGHVAIFRPLVMPGLGYGVETRLVMEGDRRFVPSNKPLQSVLAELKQSLLVHGGAPEAVRLFNELVPLTKKELQMAKEKLAGKAAATKTPDPAPVAAAKKAVGSTSKTTKAPAEPKADKAKKPLPAALQKAADAKKAAGAANDGKKLSITTEKKANPYRDGTKAHATFEHFKAFAGKTVGEMKAASDPDAHDLGYLRYASRDGHIAIG